MPTLKSAFTAAVLCLGLFTAAPAAFAMGGDDSSTSSASGGYALAEQLIKAEDYGKAITELKKLDTSGNADVLNLLGFAHRKLGKVDEGIAYYMQALRIDAEHKGAHEYLGEAYLQKDDIKSAEDVLAKLKSVCGIFGCKEFDKLQGAIAEYKSKNGSSS